MLLVIAAVLAAPPAPSFRTEIQAVLIRGGCNSGPCHGNLTGKGGFKLSLRGEDFDFDFQKLTREFAGRRTDPLNPDQSLILRKASGKVPHEGGVRFSADGPEYAAIRGWIAAGCPDDRQSPPPRKLVVTPSEKVLYAPADRLRITARALFADGSERDVTALAAFDVSTIGLVRVTPSGEVVREAYGETVVLVRYLGLQQPVRIAFAPDLPAPDVSVLKSGHRIDELVAAQLSALRVPPSPACPDEVFVRRAYLDAVGLTPTADEVRSFLSATEPDKRQKLIDDLLERPEFAEYWALKWGDLLRNEEKSLDRKGVQGFHRWLRDGFAADKPLTDFARELLSARGNTYLAPAANFYRAVRDPYARAEAVAQVFLGVRVGCARCHNHPFDRWTQDDYHRLAAFFPRVQYRVLSNTRKDDLDKHEFVGAQVVFADRTSELIHPKTGKPAAPKFLGAPTPDLGGDADRLGAFAEWVADPSNPFFARAQANRVWYHLTGRGLVDPNDDFRASNPPANPALLEHLAGEFTRGGSRLRPFVRHIMTSRVYQLASTPTPGNESDETHLAKATARPLSAEALLDAISRSLEGNVRFAGYPVGTRAGALPAAPQGGRRGNDMTGSTRFMKTFGKPDRLLTCECERSDEAGLLQAFQMLTGRLVDAMLKEPDNRIGRLLSAGRRPEEVLDELYLASLARYPSPEEKAELLAYVGKSPDGRKAWEDVAWGLVNAKEFLLRR